MANKTKDPVVTAQFGGRAVNLRWDYNTVAELQDLGYDFTDDAYVKGLQADLEAGKTPSLKMLRAWACAALISGSDEGEIFTPIQVGRVVSADEKSDLFEKVTELMRLAHGDAEATEDRPLAEAPQPSA